MVLVIKAILSTCNLSYVASGTTIQPIRQSSFCYITLSEQPNHRLPCFPPPGLVQLPGQIGLSVLFPMVFQSAGGVAKTLPGGTGGEGGGAGDADAGG